MKLWIITDVLRRRFVFRIRKNQTMYGLAKLENIIAKANV